MEEPEPDFNVALPTHNNWKIPKLSYGTTPEVPSLSRAASVAHSQQLGRHLVANRDIDTGISYYPFFGLII